MPETSSVNPGRHIANYLRPLKDNMRGHYQWEISQDLIDRYELAGSEYEQTTQLKSLLRARLAQALNDNARRAIARVWIMEWGRIPRLQDESLREIVAALTPLHDQPRPAEWEFPFKRISSWSKYLALVCP